MKPRYFKLCLLALIFILGFWLRTYNLPQRYGFGWDQQDDAVKVMEMVKGEKFTLIGPRVAGPDSFFVPAWHYYFLVPFYYVGKGSPWFGAFSAIFVGMITVLTYYFVGSKLWGERVGLFSAWAGALAYSIVSWNVMYTPALSILVFYLGSKMFDDKRYAFPAITLALVAGTTHLVPATLFVMILIGILLIKQKPKWQTTLGAILLGLLGLVPLLIFDLRHDFFNSKKFFEFVLNQGSEATNTINLLALRAYYRGFSFMSGYNLGQFWYIAERIILLLFIFFGIVNEEKRNKKPWYSVWFVFPAVILLFYHKNIPEYYYGVPIALIPLFVAKSAEKNKGYWVTLFLILISVLQVKRVYTERLSPSLNDKQEIVNFMIKYSENRKFNFSYDLPFGEEVGYPYIFTWLKKEPTTTNDSRLYSLIVLPEKTGELVIYKRSGLGIVER